MARILAISSQVARGHVGLSIIVPALQALGHDVIALPTIILSNHPGHAHAAGTQIAPSILAQMFEALSANGWLGGVDAILTGYLPSVAHVAFARNAVLHIKQMRGSNSTIHLCDPVLGDDPKGLYIDEAAANAIRDQLNPIADIATPNRFELSFLTRRNIRSVRDALAHPLKIPLTIATSIPSANVSETINALISDQTQSVTRVPLRPNAPHGTGDLFSALILAAVLGNQSTAAALAFATAGVDQALAKSAHHDNLQISALPKQTRLANSWPLEPI